MARRKWAIIPANYRVDEVTSGTLNGSDWSHGGRGVSMMLVGVMGSGRVGSHNTAHKSEISHCYECTQVRN